MGRPTDRHTTDKHTDRQRESQTGRHTDRERTRQPDRQRESQRQADTQTEREPDSQTGRLTHEGGLSEVAPASEDHLQDLGLLIHHQVLLLQGDPGPVQAELLLL